MDLEHTPGEADGEHDEQDELVKFSCRLKESRLNPVDNQHSERGDHHKDPGKPDLLVQLLPADVEQQQQEKHQHRGHHEPENQVRMASALFEDDLLPLLAGSQELVDSLGFSLPCHLSLSLPGGGAWPPRAKPSY